MAKPLNNRDADPRTSSPVFVVGVFRSGTSLLYSLLNQHSQMALMFECDVWDFPESFSRLRFRGDWLGRQEFYNQALSRHRLIFGGSLAGLEQAKTPEQLYRIFSDAKGAARWGEKSPFYCARLQQLLRRYPGASFILLWRDPVEIYRSIVHAGRQERFFRRRGMLTRLIHSQEQMIRETRELTRAGARIHHVTYSGLIDECEQTCRGICQFLGIDFELSMLDLAQADFTAIYRAPQHEHLRRGVVERHHFAEPLDPARVEKLQRFRERWNRLTAAWVDQGSPLPAGPEPSMFERLSHWMTGSLLSVMDNAKRALFEFLPLPWLRTYRQAAYWLFFRRPAERTPRPPLREQISSHWITILVGWITLFAVATIDHLTGPRVVLGPFYLLPCAALTLILGRRWGGAAALFSAIVLTTLRVAGNLEPQAIGVLLWNLSMRFLFFEVVVLLLDRIRIEMNSNSKGNL